MRPRKLWVIILGPNEALPKTQKSLETHETCRLLWGFWLLLLRDDGCWRVEPVKSNANDLPGWIWWKLRQEYCCFCGFNPKLYAQTWYNAQAHLQRCCRHEKNCETIRLSSVSEVQDRVDWRPWSCLIAFAANKGLPVVCRLHKLSRSTWGVRRLTPRHEQRCLVAWLTCLSAPKQADPWWSSLASAEIPGPWTWAWVASLGLRWSQVHRVLYGEAKTWRAPHSHSDPWPSMVRQLLLMNLDDDIATYLLLQLRSGCIQNKQ